jgi:pyridoxal phosphate enzyme (YggS family)
MLTGPQFLAAALPGLRKRIAAAEAAAGRPPGAVTLVAVSKGQPVESVAAARAAGIRDFGENYLREALPKLDQVPRTGLAWHYLGQLQSNKTRGVAEHFDWVHSVDRLRIAERLSQQRAAQGPPLQVCLQVSLVSEPGKGGVSPGELPELAAEVARLPRVKLRGLMAVPPERLPEQETRAHFAELRRLRDLLNAAGHGLDTLSMGMSQDFELAIAEGATHVRIGTALFGARPAPPPEEAP